MQTVILCGGRGLRMGDETRHVPKALVSIGGLPVIWHVMKHYAHHGFRDFVLCLGYKGELIRDFFLSYNWHRSDFRLELQTGRTFPLGSGGREDWRITFVDTGLSTQTGGRLLRVAEHVQGERFFVTYADAVTDVDLQALLAFHDSHKATATVTGVRPRSTFGLLETDGPWVMKFHEKAVVDRLASGGFFVFDRAVLQYLDGDGCVLEEEPMRRLAGEHRLAVYEHTGFWECMDTQKDAVRLDHLWRETQPWKVWDD